MSSRQPFPSACLPLLSLLLTLISASVTFVPKQIVLENTPTYDKTETEFVAANKTNPLDEEFGKLVHRYLERFHAPSLSIAIVDDEEIYSHAYGIAQLPNIQATPDTLYYAGSTTKSFTAALLTILIDDDDEGAGRLGPRSPLTFQTPLVDIVPELRLKDDYATLHTTLEDALSHRTGLPGHDSIYGGENYTSDDILQALPFLGLTTPFRTTYQYCNTLYMVVSRAIENLTRKPLGTVLGDRIWGELHMYSTYFSLADAQEAVSKESKVLARGYFWDDVKKDWVAERYMDESVIAGAGNIITTVMDYGKYLRCLIQQGYPMSPKGHRELRRPRSFPEPGAEAPEHLSTTYSLGWIQISYRGEIIQCHSGGLHGFGAVIAYLPSRKWGVTMLSNTEMRSQFVEMALLFHLVDDLLGIPQEERTDYAGYYESKLQSMYESFVNGKQRLFPDIPKPPLKLSLPLQEYTGEYLHPAYRNLTLHLGDPEHPGAGKDAGPVLRFDMLDRTWPSVFNFEHVSGEHFVAWKLPAKESPTLISRAAMKAEFRIGVNGKVSELGIGMEPAMGEEKIWWTRVK